MKRRNFSAVVATAALATASLITPLVQAHAGAKGEMRIAMIASKSSTSSATTSRSPPAATSCRR